MNILIIDDDHSLRYMLKEICKYAGWDSIAAENGYQGVELFKEVKPDLVLVDYHMPEMDGLQTVKMLRKMDTVTPLIVLTVDERQEIADEFLKEGASDFALKPVKAPDIIARIQLHIRLANIQDVQKNEGDVFTEKGISKKTLTLIADYLETNSQPCSVDDISKEVGLAYPTVYRYLMHLLEVGKVKQIVSHQRIGRPKNLYKWYTK
ncbi:response regulator [Thalassobacillus devorans]|uniref:response regulator n=1 Tax=Thalassobacillus devorans TaxID=279813 RepID=UPI000490A1E6|nr:response regulator [Thalassobacillus devorans]